MPDDQKFLNIDLNGYNELKKLYDKAVADKADSFKFQGATLVTSYAKYMIQFLKPKFEA